MQHLAPFGRARTRALSTLSLLALTAVVAPGCGSDDDAAGAANDEISYELFESTRQLADADLAALANVTDDGVLSFTSETPALAGIDVGQVILAGASTKTPYGLLRVVTSVDRTSGLVLRTAAAPPQVAFRKLHVRAKRSLEAFGPNAPLGNVDASPLTLRPQLTLVKGQGDKSQSYQIVIFDGDGDVETKNDQIAIDATLGGGFTYALSIDVDWGAVDKLPQVVSECLAAVAKIVTGEKPTCRVEDLVPEANTTFDVDPFVSLDVQVHGAASLEFEKELEIGTVNLPPVPLGPLVFHPTVDVLASVKGGASASFDVNAKARADLESSIVISSKNAGSPQYNPPRLKSFDVKADPPTINLHANAEASVGARLNVSLYSLIGPYATVSGIATIDAAPLENPCWKLHFGLETLFGVRITSPKLPVVGYVTLADAKTPALSIVDQEVASGACIVPPDPPRPPGSGPSPTTYQSPAFTPWAKVLSGAVVDGIGGISVGQYLGANATLMPSIDGRLLVGAPFALGLHKLDENGNVTWLSKLVTESAKPHRVLRSVATPDAGILSLLKPEDTAAFVLARSSQSGVFESARSYTLVGDCVPTVSDILADAGRGYLVTGRCAGGDGFLVRIDASGNVVRARTMAEEGSAKAFPVSATISEGEVVLVGEVARPNELEWTFASRLDAEDRPTTSTAFYCPERISAQPMSVIPSENGGVTVVGTANGLGMVARIRKDGTVGFARFPNIGVGVASTFVVSSVVELSTTGMVIGGSASNVSDEAPNAIVLAGLDSAGSVLWSERYSVAGASDHPLSSPAIRLTDDGGLFVSAVGSTADGQVGDLYAMKVFAKDGSLPEGQPLVRGPSGLVDGACQTESRALGLVLRDVAVDMKPATISRQ